MIAVIKNAFINQVLQHLLDGNKGSNILTALLVPLLAAKIDWTLAIKGLQLDDLAAATALAQVVGILVLGVFGYFVGKKTPTKTGTAA